MSGSTHPTQERIIGFDLIRTWALYAITVYHCTWTFWPDGKTPIWPSLGWKLFIADGAYISSYSGFTLVLLASFLLGMKPRAFAGKPWLPLFIVGAWVVFSVILALREDRPFSMWWDVYSLLFVGFSSGDYLLLGASKHRVLWVLGASAVTLLIPFWWLEPYLPFGNYWKAIWVGVCPDDYSDWPVLPWIALCWGGMALGRLMKMRPDWRVSYRRGEIWGWVVIVPWFLGAAVVYSATPLGDGWACYMFRQPPYIFWGYLAGLLLLMRVSLIPEVQSKLAEANGALWVSNLHLNRHFFLAYFVQFCLCFGVGGWINSMAVPPGYIYDVGFFSALIGTEVATRVLVKIGKSL